MFNEFESRRLTVFTRLAPGVCLNFIFLGEAGEFPRNKMSPFNQFKSKTLLVKIKFYRVVVRELETDCRRGNRTRSNNRLPITACGIVNGTQINGIGNRSDRTSLDVIARRTIRVFVAPSSVTRVKRIPRVE
jgi:hypothetical protein